jgi:hypothetical protein
MRAAARLAATTVFTLATARAAIECPEMGFFDEVSPSSSRRVAMVMLDDRPLLPDASAPSSKADLAADPSPEEHGYWSLAIALNHAYTESHGYFFTLFRPPSLPSESPNASRAQSASTQLSSHWHKADALLRALRSPELRCNDLVMYIDSDAVVRLHDETPLEFLRRQAAKGAELRREWPWNAVGIEGASIVVAEGDGGDVGVWMPWGFSVQWTNTGVMIIRKTRRAEILLEAWRRSALRQDMAFYRHRWPYDQEAFNRLVYPSNRDQIALLPMRSMNSPEGEWVTHIWGGVSGDRLPKLASAARHFGLSGKRLRAALEIVRDVHSYALDDWTTSVSSEGKREVRGECSDGGGNCAADGSGNVRCAEGCLCDTFHVGELGWMCV